MYSDNRRAWYSVNEIDEVDSTVNSMTEYTARSAKKLAAALAKEPTLKCTRLIRVWRNTGYGAKSEIFLELKVQS
jgi:hypothetical protein